MKLLIFTIFSMFFKVNSFPRSFQKSSLAKAFSSVSEFLVDRNHLVSLVTFGDVKIGEAEATVYAATAGIPHIVTRWNKMEKFLLNSSAIVLLNSVGWLKVFNSHTDVPMTFSMSQQLFIYCKEATFDEISLIFNP